MLDFVLNLVTDSPVTYAAVCGLVAADAVFPLIPGETVCLTAGVIAADGELAPALVLVAAVLGGALGDNVSYAIGFFIGPRATTRLFRRGRSRTVLLWVRRQLTERPAPIIVTARFLPGGRTATTFAAGTVELSWRRFALIDLVAVSLWAVYAVMLGYLGGQTFQGSLWKPLLVAAGVAAAVSFGGEFLRRRAST